MKACCFDNCRSKLRHRRQGVSFHEFPSSEEIRKKWVMVVRNARQDQRWNPTPVSRVCSLHFNSCQFLSKRVLHARAVPSAKYQLPRFMRGGKRSAEPDPDPDLIDLENDIPDASMGFPSDPTQEAANDAVTLESSTAAEVLVQLAGTALVDESSSVPATAKIVEKQVETEATAGASNLVVDLTPGTDSVALLNKELVFAQFLEIPPAQTTAEGSEKQAETPSSSAVVADSPVVLTGDLFNYGDNAAITAESSLPSSDYSVDFEDFETAHDHATISAEDLEAFAASSAVLLGESAEILNESFDDQLTQPL